MPTKQQWQRRLICIIIFLLSGFASAKPLNICVLDTGPGSDHERKVFEVLKKNLKDCSKCKIISHPIYDLNGDLTVNGFRSALERAISECEVINLSWNVFSTSDTKPIEDKLSEAAGLKILIAASGAPDKAITKPLSDTVLGKIHDAILIAELNKESHLDLYAYYGPEIFTALPVSEANPGSSFTAPIFAAAVAKWLSKNPKASIKKLKLRLRELKKNSHEQYPSLKTLELE